jgi:hypothetical protein
MNDAEIDALEKRLDGEHVSENVYVDMAAAAHVIVRLRNEVVRLRAGLEEAKHANDDADLFDIVERVLNG